MNQNDERAEAQIRAVMDGWVEAFRTKSVERALEVHAPDAVAFDIVAPLRYRGLESYGTAWRAAFQAFDGPIAMTLRDVTITVRDDIGFSFSLNRFIATSNDGQTVDYWFRWTACFQRLDERWVIVHDHTSLPTDFATGRSVQDLQP